MKKLARFFCWALIVFVLLLVGLEWGVRTVTRKEWFRKKVEPYVESALNRDIKIERMGASFSGLLLDGVEIAEAGGFEKGTFLSAGKIRVRFSLIHLLHLHLKIHDVILKDTTVNITRFKDGSLNVETLADNGENPSEEEKEEDPAPEEDKEPAFRFTLENTELQNLTVHYTDEADGLALSARNLSLIIHHFSLDKEFPFTLNSVLSYGDSFKVTAGLYGKMNLENFDFSKAYAEIVNLVVKKDKTTLQANAKIHDWTHPVFSVEMKAKQGESSLSDPWTKLPDFTIPSIAFTANGEADLDNNLLKIEASKLTVDGASVSVRNSSLNYDKITYSANANASVDFEKLYAWLPQEWQQYILEKGTMNLSAKATQKQVAGNVAVVLPQGQIKADGSYVYKSGDYHVKADVDADVESTVALLPDEYEKHGLKGAFKGYVDMDTTKVISTFTLTQGGFFNPRTGRFSNVKLEADVQGKWDGSDAKVAVKMAGDLNQSPFTADVSLRQTPQVINAEINAYSKRIALPSAPAAPAANENEPEFVSDTSLEPTTQTAWKLPPVHLKSNIKIDSLDAPYLYTAGLSFTSDVEGLTPDLKNAHGVLKLTLEEGKILNLYQLTSSSPLTKVLFLSLNVVGKVFNSLNVFSVLNGIKGGIISAVTSSKDEKDTGEQRMVVQTITDENGNPVDMLVPYTEQKVDGEQAYDKFETEVKFVSGVATVRKGTFVSNMMSFRLDGTTDFNNGTIAMKVHAAPGKHEVNGVMPLTVNISGTVDNPKGSMSMVGSVTSLVTQAVTKNVVSRNVHKGVKSIVRLFKTDGSEEAPQEEAAQEITGDAETAETDSQATENAPQATENAPQSTENAPQATENAPQTEGEVTAP